MNRKLLSLLFLGLSVCFLSRSQQVVPLTFALMDSIKACSPAVWGADSKTLYFTAAGTLVRFSIETGRFETVSKTTGFTGTPRISRDHRRLAVQHGTEVWIVDPLDGSCVAVYLGDLDSRWDLHPGGNHVRFAGAGHLWSRISVSGRHARVKKSPGWFGINTLFIDTIAVFSESGIVLIFSPYASPIEWSPDGARLYFLSAQTGWTKIWSVGADGSGLRKETSGPGDDRDFQVAADGSLIFVSNRERRVEWSLWRQDQGGVPRQLFGRGGMVQGPALSPDGAVISFLFSTPTSPSELFVLDLKSGAARKLTRNGPASLAHQTVSPSIVQFPSGERTIEGILYVPPAASPEHPVPAVIRLHGGPSMHDGLTWNTSHQYLASRGYAVLAINYTGSVGYGKVFEEADMLRIGYEDCDDIAAGARFLASLPAIKANRLGVSGSSYGGYLTNIVIGRYPHLFAAAVSWFGITNWFSLQAFRHLHPVVRYFFLDRMGDSTSHANLYRFASPITYVDSVRTPLLLAHGDADTVVPVGQSNEFYNLLKGKGKNVWLSIYGGEGHGWGQKENRFDAYRQMEAWFRQYLME